MKFVDEQNDVTLFFNFFDNVFKTLFKVTSVFAARNHRSNVEGYDSLIFQRFGYAALNDVLCKPLCDSGFTDAGFTDKTGVILCSSRKNLNYPFNLRTSADYRVNLVFANHFGQVGTVRVQIRGVLAAAVLFCGAAAFMRIAFGLARSGKSHTFDYVGIKRTDIYAGGFDNLDRLTVRLFKQGHKNMFRSDYIIARPTSFDERPFEDPFQSRCHILPRDIGGNADTYVFFDPFNDKFIGKSRIEQNF